LQPQCVPITSILGDLATPAEFDLARRDARPDEVKAKRAVSSNHGWFIDNLHELASVSLTTICLRHIGRNLERVI